MTKKKSATPDDAVGRYIKGQFGRQLTDGVLILAYGSAKERERVFGASAPVESSDRQHAIEMARTFLEHPWFKRSILARKRAGRLPPDVERLIRRHAPHLLDLPAKGGGRKDGPH